MQYGCDILIPENNGRIGLLVMSSLSAKGLTCQMMDWSGSPKNEPGYIHHLKKKIEECHPRMIMPIFMAEIIAKYRNELPEDIIIPIDEYKHLRELDNKVSASNLCTRLGIPQPRLYSDEQISQIETYPVVFKREDGLSGSSVYFPKTEKALANLVKASNGKGHLVMDFIDGYDVCVDAVRWDGYFHAECYKVILPKRKGISILRKGVDRPDLIEQVKLILNTVDYKGVCGTDFRVDKTTGKTYFLECNPRFSGGLKSQIEGGFDMPYILWQIASGYHPEAFYFKKGRYSIEFDDLWALIKSNF